MCSPFNVTACAAVVQAVLDAPGQVAQDMATDTLSLLLSGLNTALHAAVKAMMTLLAGWMLVPSNPVCPGADTPDWITTCATVASPATQLRAWILPITILVATLGLLWQAILLTVTRKGEPLLQALRGLGTLALWSAVGIVGTQLALKASDAYTVWILKQAIVGDSPNPVDSLGTALSSLSPAEAFGVLLLGVLFNFLILIIVVVQLILMVFREASVIILAGLLQLAAAGSFTRLTSGWLPKVTGWMLALVCFKPMAATVYAVAFLLLGSDGVRNSIVGLAVLLLALFALPVAMKFFNWTTGTINTGPSTVGMLGTAGAAGMHAASSMRGAGGYHVGDHASYMDQHGPGTAATSSSAPTGAATATAPAGAASVAGSGGAASAAGTAGAAGPAATVGASAAAGAATGGASVAAQAGFTAADAARRAADNAATAASDAAQGR
jgi:hypothetical protein